MIGRHSGCLPVILRFTRRRLSVSATLHRFRFVHLPASAVASADWGRRGRARFRWLSCALLMLLLLVLLSASPQAASVAAFLHWISVVLTLAVSLQVTETTSPPLTLWRLPSREPLSTVLLAEPSQFILLMAALRPPLLSCMPVVLAELRIGASLLVLPLVLLLVLAAVSVAAGIACSSAAGVACFRCNRSCFFLWGDSSPISLRAMFVAVSIASGVICEATPALPAPTPQGPQVNGHTGGGVPGLGTASFGIGGG